MKNPIVTRLLCGLSDCFPEPDHLTWDSCNRLFTQAEFLLRRYRDQLPPERGFIQLLRRYGAFARERGQFLISEEVLKFAVDLCVRAEPSDEEEKVQIQDDLARLCLSSGRYAESWSFLENAFQMRIDLFGGHSAELSHSRYLRSSFHYATGNLNAAAEEIRHACRQLSKSKPSVKSLAMLNLASAVFIQMGFVTDAEKYQSAADLLLEALGDSVRRHPEHSQVLLGRGRILWAKSEHQVAESLVEEALSLRRDALGPRHQRNAGLLFSLAHMAMSRKAYDSADKHFTEALDIQRCYFPDNHPNVALIISDIGELRARENKLDVAVKHFSQAYESCKNSRLISHPKFLKRVQRFAEILSTLGLKHPPELPELLSRTDVPQGSYVLDGW